eukprot:scaffold25184_cov62-Phaeocystis_antarctica.AAC.6
MEEGRRGGLTRLRRLLPRHAGVCIARTQYHHHHHQQQYQHCAYTAPTLHTQAPVHVQRCAPRGCSHRPTTTTATPPAPCPCPTRRTRMCPRRSNRRVLYKCQAERLLELGPFAPLLWGAPRGSGRLDAPEIIAGERPDRCLGCSSEPLPPSTTRTKQEVAECHSPVHPTPPRTRPWRVTSARSLARSPAGSREAAPPACRAMPTRTHRGRESRGPRCEFRLSEGCPL